MYNKYQRTGRGRSSSSYQPPQREDRSESGYNRRDPRQRPNFQQPPPPLPTTGEITAFQLEANFFKLTRYPEWKLYHYNVDYKPAIESTLIRKGLLKVHRRHLGGYLFDGSSLWTTHLICANENDIKVFKSKRKSDDTEIEISIKLVGDVDFGDYHYLQVYNVIMRTCLRNLKFQLVGRNYFDAGAKIQLQHHRIELWPGYNTAINQYEQDLLFCCELTHKVMRNDNALNVLDDFAQTGDPNYKDSYRNYMIGAIVITRYNNQTYRIEDCDFSQNPLSTFTMKDGTTETYKDYFQRRYGDTINRMEQPLLASSSTERKRKGGGGPVFLVPELCCMTGLNDNMRSNYNLMRDLANETRVTPDNRIEKLLAFNRRLTNTPEVSDVLKQWNMGLEKNLVTLDGKLLPLEIIRFGNNFEVSAGTTDRNGMVNIDWTRAFRNCSLFISNNLTNWICIAPNRSMQQLDQFTQHMADAARGLGIFFPQPIRVEIQNDRTDSYTSAIDDSHHRYNPQLMIILTPNNKFDRYAAIKRKCILEHGVPSQVLLYKTATNKNALSIATKVLIQINAKLGGAPWSIPLPSTEIMVVGYESSQDPANKTSKISAMVISIDRTITRYYSTVTHRGGEISVDFIQNFMKGIIKYREVNEGKLPQFIIVYRGGVSDGNIKFLKEQEVEPLKKELGKLYEKSQNPFRLAFILVSAKTSTRFFLNRNNPPAGTVVDSVVTLPTRFDFYLISQSVRQGSVSPTYYNVIEDSLGLSPENIQRFTYKMTHLYYNWSGTVCVPAPCQYAKKLAFVSSQSLHVTHDNMSDMLYYL